MWQHGQQVQLETAVETVPGIYWVCKNGERGVLISRDLLDSSQVAWIVLFSEKEKPQVVQLILPIARVRYMLPILTSNHMKLIFGTKLSPCANYVNFLAYRQTRDAALEFLLLCKHQLIPIHRDIVRVIARIVYDSYAESIWIK